MSFWRSRKLIARLAQREILGRYRGSYFGILWAIINPLLLLAVYTFVFTEVFKSRWNVAGHVKTDFAMAYFAGAIVYNVFAESINRAPSVIVSNPNYVKKVVFPLEILPLVVLATSLFHAVIGFLILICACAYLGIAPTSALAVLPLTAAALCLMTVGFVWLLGSLGVYFRDLGQVVGPLTALLLFLSPVFYPTDALPETYRWLLHLNPLTSMIEQVRTIILYGKSPDPGEVALCLGMSGLFAWVGFAWFQKTRRGFADVM